MTYFKKDPVQGWAATTEVALEDSKVLTIRTSKTNGHLVTSASVGIEDGGFIRHRLYRDYMHRVSVSSLRCTEKNVANLHQGVITELLDDIKRSVAAHYAKEAK